MKQITILLLFLSQFTVAQTSQQTPTLKESVEALGNLFKKKDKEQTEGIVVSSNSQNIKHIQGGKIAENAVYINADRFTDFNNGVAIIHKGNSTAMINEKGDMIFPYNTHAFFTSDNTFRQNNHEIEGIGIFKYNSNHFMNARGKELQGMWSANGLNKTDGLLEYSKELYDKPKNRQGNYQVLYFYMDKDGKSYTSDCGLVYIREGIGIYSEYVEKEWRYGYRKLTGERLTEPLYNEAIPFSGGMAVVGKKDEFGLVKYGFINHKGQLAIPLMFSVKPASFSCNLAKVKPKNSNEFQYAFINNKGEVVFKQTAADFRKYGNKEFESFQNFGISVTTDGFYVMDTLFNIQSKIDFFARFGITGTSHFQKASYEGKGISNDFLFSVTNETNPKIYFSNNEMNYDGVLRGKELRIGFINLATNTVVLPAFSKIGYFDPVSHLAYAETRTVEKGGDGFTNQIKATKGYINEKGEWVILQKQESTW